MGHKAAETTLNINQAFGPGTADKRTVQWWFYKFHKGDKSLGDEEYCDVRREAYFIQQQVMSGSVVGLRRTSKARLAAAAGLIYYSFLNPGETIPSEKDAQQIDEVHRKLQRLQLVLANRKGPILLDDNAGPHIAQLTLSKLNELGYEVLPHLPYSPDLLPTDHFFKNLDNVLQGKHFYKQSVKNAFQTWIFMLQE
ncbi:hypothetical protein AV530_007616 [Patagioenas fasciata monilis]|uniref:Mos1 transposase HTH domain-containing protein n=1 Tax=Patagioenas fasciata monilis TaxID=372326 RepID=A0A1V4JYJ1_PATFA|nr:hypothetical protein AV530_007616 [Patagioenas fasciata monilis]